MPEPETHEATNLLAAQISIAAIDLIAKYDPDFFESKQSENFSQRLQEAIRNVIVEFFDEQKKH